MSFDTAQGEWKAYREETVRFYHGETELAGVLCLPEGTGPHPVVVFIHGSGPTGRDGYHRFPPLWQAFARLGCASLSWDKPGVGESTGDWRLQTVQDRAREGLAALTFLAQRADIDARRMGVYGRSQAGWVIPHLVQMTDLVACIIAVSVSVSSGTEQDLYRIAHQLPADGFAPEGASPPVKKTRSRKKSEMKTPAATGAAGSAPLTDSSVEPVPAPPKRGRRKKSTEESEQESEALPKRLRTVSSEMVAKQDETEDSLSKPKPKRRRSVGEPAPKRYAVGDVVPPLL